MINVSRWLGNGSARRLRFLLVALASTVGLSPLLAEPGTEGKTRMDRFVVSEKHLLSFGIAITLWEDKFSGRVLEMHVPQVQEGGNAEQEGVIAGTRIYGINGRDVNNFLATFSAGSELNQLFIDRAKGDQITLEVLKPGHRTAEFVTLQNQSGLTVKIRTKAPTSGVELRAQENAEVYRDLKRWEQKYVDKGAITAGFTPAMVYIALGEPTDKETKGFGEYQLQLWTYQRCFPDPDTIRGFEPAALTLNAVNPDADASKGASQNNVTADNKKTGSSTLRAYTVQVLFEGGKVTRMAAILDEK